jgi:hypothetical protein
MSFCVVTDVKLDDLLAIIVLCATGHASHIHFVISDIRDQVGASSLLDVVMSETAKTSCVSYDICFGPKTSEAKSHETMYEHFERVRPGTIPIGQQYDYVFVLAPSPLALDIMASTMCGNFIGLGYNSHGYTVEQLNKVPFLAVHNNFGSFKKGQEGGRFAVNDTELWNIVAKWSPTITSKVVPLALRNSHAFVVEILKDVGIELGSRDIFDESVLKDCVESKSDDGYLPRVIEQLRLGFLDVECTDGQQMATWVNNTCKLTKIKLVQTEHFIEMVPTDEEKDIMYAPMNLTRESVRRMFLESISTS